MMEDKKIFINLSNLQLSNSKGVIIACYLMMISYFYNLPVMNYSIKGENDIRIYDLVGVYLFYLYLTNIATINQMITKVKVLNRMFQFLLWTTATLPFTFIFSVMEGKVMWSVQSMLYLYHFWTFFLASVFLAFIIRDLNQLKKMVNLCLILSIVSFLIVILQNFEIVPFLWSDSYKESYLGFLSGTFGPNKIVVGMSSLIMLIFSLGLFNDSRVKISKTLLIVNIGMSLLALIMSGSRTSYVGLGVFAAYFLLKDAPKFVASLVVLVSLFFTVSYLNPKVIEKATEIYQNRVDKKIKDPKSLNDARVDKLYKDLGAGRDRLSASYVEYLLEKPYIIPFGIGFNNRLIIGFSAHNIYLSLINEVGILGLFLYLRWMFSYFSVNMRFFAQMQTALKGLVIAMLVTLCFGEHLYVYRPLFGLVGLFLFITTFLLSPIYIVANETK
ncbi:O-antigen ligase family protein [Flavobacterium sp. SM15]|uniref:O-antigen ligase family protein n=1 Tax=Flavobacterium sp. SM15 TaxID=2908005 RepID=UPI001EDB611A|nr:O-antigen ligase family protein [Flavobacterium sp. SM15]MCG2611245.1 O-antigen ligase family protein [Flavobacterium sp. SM15]